MTRPQDPNLREQILQHLQTLKIPLSAEQLDQLLASATREKLSHLQLLERLLALPAQQRRERGIERRLRLARFRDPASLESFDWQFNAATIEQAPLLELASGEFVRRRENLVFVGKSGVGKSHLIQSIGRCCCVLGYGVRYYGRFDLLIIDEFGFDKLERLEYPESPSLLYKVIDHRSRRGSTALVTNLDFQGWSDYLGDPPLAMALLDRVVDGAIIQRMDGKSYREYRAEQKKAGTRQPKARQPGKS